MIFRRVGAGIVVTAAAMVAVAVGAPLVVDEFQLLQLTVFASMPADLATQAPGPRLDGE